ncbi:MAG: adenylyltransferase/cytidyltransferase family protein [Gemmatimonadales bacterium]|nr:adenylyltransferase/cytidyltransferase family protein [Gemmatimonadales bacterium]
MTRYAGTIAKLVTVPEAIEWRRAHRGAVVFTNGVFDLLHTGHVEYLEAARALGSALVVAVNNDASARSLGKGPGRPFVAAADRARLVAALAAVDRVVLFSEPTPLALIEALSPDILVKGGDYTRDTVVGADWVEGRGGKVVLIPVIPGQSTTSIVERIRGSS